MKKPELLIISFSDLYRDVRILKQIRLFEDEFDVTTCGYGPSPSNKVNHVEIFRREPKPLVLTRAALIRLHLFSAAYWITPEVRQAWSALSGRSFDAILANDLDTVGVACRIGSPSKVHADLHEYWPGLLDGNQAWVRIRKPYYEWMLRKYVSRVSSVTTVSEPAAELYGDIYGIQADVVANAARYVEIEPTEAKKNLRVVHAGGAQPARKIEDLMRAVAAVPDMSLDLFLVGQGTPYYQSLLDLADSLGERIRILPPVKSEELVSTLNGYDVGIHQLPPSNTNHIVAMPNKFFEYVQARLALVVGPSKGMKNLIDQHDVGVVAKDFTVAALAEALSSLDHESVDGFKENANVAARELSSEHYDPVWASAIGDIAQSNTPGRDTASADETTPPSMIFHVPFRLGVRSTSASGIRPMKMRQAFEDAGYRVLEVSGSHEERRGQIRALKKMIEGGFRPDFVYSESATTPTGLGEKVTRHTSLSRDLKFLEFCKKQGIPVGLFYRDIYWLFPQYRDYANAPMRAFLKARHKADLRRYNKGLDILFTPSELMGKYVKRWVKTPVHALPSGSDLGDGHHEIDIPRVVYVGGIGNHYEMTRAFAGAAKAEALGVDFRFVVCTRESDWETAKEEYEEWSCGSIGVEHASGEEMKALLQVANIGSLFVEPQDYRSFAVPMKLYEYIGSGLPVVASEGTLVGSLVQEMGIGWNIPYTSDAFAGLLRNLAENPSEIGEKMDRVATIAADHTWLARAQEVADMLTSMGK